ncbi:MAG TPA: hypothetical protein VF179_18890 [Thermoanaerobaculia bacterium]|nr:hypothetical protein [Thermoanaerobaculia bacterium]
MNRPDVSLPSNVIDPENMRMKSDPFVSDLVVDRGKTDKGDFIRAMDLPGEHRRFLPKAQQGMPQARPGNGPLIRGRLFAQGAEEDSAPRVFHVPRSLLHLNRLELSDTFQRLSETSRKLSETFRDLSDTFPELSETIRELSDTFSPLSGSFAPLSENSRV